MTMFRERLTAPGVTVSAVLAGVVCCTQDATAQQQPAVTQPQRQTAPATELQEVVVTAERRTENLQTTAIAATVLNRDELVEKGVVQMADLQNASPSLSVTNAGLSANVNIRGIGLDSGSPSVVPGVATYKDGLWQPPIVTTATLYDIGSVEVLRGPQGTFVGSNSTGGAIFINTRNPEFTSLEGNVQVQAGNYSDWGLTSGINLPISDSWALRAAVDAEQRESFFRDIGSQLTPSPELFNHPGALDEKNLRVGLRGKPTDDLDVLLKVDVESKSTGGYAYRPVPGTTYAPFANPDPFTLDYDHYTQNDELAVRASLKFDWILGDSGILLRSLTGDQFMRVHNIYDIDATSSALPNGPPALMNTQAIIERPVTQEFNLISPNTGRLQWILGAFYLHDIREVALDVNSQAIPRDLLIDLYFVLKSAAGFGQLTYALTPRLQLQAGVRYTSDSNSVPQSSNIKVELGIPGVPPALVPAGGYQSDSSVTGKIALNFTVNEDNFLYAFVAKGSKAGGFNAGGPGRPQTNFAPEIVWDYELGWKGTFFQKHLRASLGGFWNDYTNLQVNALNPGTGQQSLGNAGKSTIKGFEAELHGRLGGLSVDGGGAYVNSKIGALTLVDTEALPPGTNQPQCTAALAPPACFDYNPYLLNLSGSQNPFSPEWTFNAGAQYDFPVGTGTFTPRVNYSYVGSQWTTLFQLPQTDYLHSFGLWSASLTYAIHDWTVQAFGLNLADRLYVSGQSAAGLNPNNEFLGNPRQFGLRVSRRF